MAEWSRKESPFLQRTGTVCRKQVRELPLVYIESVLSIWWWHCKGGCWFYTLKIMPWKFFFLLFFFNVGFLWADSIEAISKSESNIIPTDIFSHPCHAFMCKVVSKFAVVGSEHTCILFIYLFFELAPYFKCSVFKWSSLNIKEHAYFFQSLLGVISS